MNKKTMEIIKFIGGIRLKRQKISFLDLQRKIIIEWGPSKYHIESKLNTMKLLGLITIDPLTLQVWVLHALNEEYDPTPDENAASNLLENMR